MDIENMRQQYIAVSYCWGDEADRETILVNDCELSVPRNLTSFLRSCPPGLKDVPTAFWADSICVNQEDHVERGHQVRKMKSIFEQAGFVMLWLGPADENSDVATQFIDRLYDTYMKYESDSGADYSAELAKRLLFAKIIRIEEFRAENPDWKTKTLRDWNALESLLSRAWWSRVWIMQEATTNNRTVLSCGRWYIDFDQRFWFSLMAAGASFAIPISQSPMPNELRTLSDRIACACGRPFHNFFWSSRLGAATLNCKILHDI